MHRTRPLAPSRVVLAAALAVAFPAVAAADSARSRPAPPSSRQGTQASQPRVQPARQHGQPAAPAQNPHAQNPYAHMLPPYIPGSVSMPYRSDRDATPRHRGSVRYGTARYGTAGVVPVYVPVQPAYQPPPEPVYAPEAPPPVVVVVERPVAAAPAPAPVPVAPPPPPPPPRPRDTEPGEVWLDIVPTDARVYLDDRFVGTAGQLSDPDEPLVLAAGVYVLAVEHPDHRRQRLVFAAGSRTPALIEVDLGEEQPRRRARLTTPRDLPLSQPGSS